MCSSKLRCTKSKRCVFRDSRNRNADGDSVVRGPVLSGMQRRRSFDGPSDGRISIECPFWGRIRTCLEKWLQRLNCDRCLARWRPFMSPRRATWPLACPLTDASECRRADGMPLFLPGRGILDGAAPTHGGAAAQSAPLRPSN